MQTGKVRNIRLVLDEPKAWTTSNPNLLQQGGDTSPMYVRDSVGAIVRYSIGVLLRGMGHETPIAHTGSIDCSIMATSEIKSIHRIENFTLWQKYNVRCRASQQEHDRLGVKKDRVWRVNTA